MRLVCAALALLATPAAQAAQFTVEVPEAADATATERMYDCGKGDDMFVLYYDAADVSLARFEIEGRTFVGALVISGSGARYAAGRYIWWTKGEEASLFDVTRGDDAPPVLTCKTNDR